MVGRASQEWHPRPSQLRNEMRHTPSDDSRAFAEEKIQVPDSQTEVPDTQVPSDALSPGSAAVVRQCTVSKNTTPTFSMLPVKMFSKEPSLGESRFPAETPVGFVFGQPSQGPNKPLPKPKVSVAQGEGDPAKTDSSKAVGEYLLQLGRREAHDLQMRSTQAGPHVIRSQRL